MVEHGGLRHLAPEEADAEPVLYVDGRVEDHEAAPVGIGERSENLGVIVPGDQLAVGNGVGRVGPPADIAERFVGRDGGGLGRPDIQVERGEALFARRFLDRERQQAREPVPAGPGGDEMGRGRGREALGLVVARRPDELGGARDRAAIPADEQLAFGHQEHAGPVAFEHLARRRGEPAEAAAFEDRRIGCVAEIGEVAGGKALDPLDRDDRRLFVHGRHSRNREISASPLRWLFSG